MQQVSYFDMKMVDQPEYCTNTCYIIDFIQINVNPKFLNIEEIKELFVQKRLSASQTGRKLGVAKSVILKLLNGAGVQIGKVGRSTDPKNYTNNSPPYGYMIRDGKLAPNKSEMKICRLVVELRGRRSYSTTQVANELERLGYKNRKGNTVWNTAIVSKVYRLKNLCYKLL